MRTISPATAIFLAALFIALQTSGFAAIDGQSSRSARDLELLASPITIGKNLPAENPRGFVMCPSGFRAFGAGHDSWGGLDAYKDVRTFPAFWNPHIREPETFRDSGEGPQWPADGFLFGAKHDPSRSGPHPLKAIVICAKVVRIRR